jgi:hypothetical protein
MPLVENTAARDEEISEAGKYSGEIVAHTHSRC